jgi:hypothetical protein
MTYRDIEERRAYDRARWVGERRESNNRARRERREFLRNWLDTLKTLRGCADCGTHETVVLDWDHVRGEKSFNVTPDHPEAYLLAEIAKCEVRCANCHRRRHFG